MQNCSYYPSPTNIIGWHALVVLQGLFGTIALGGHILIFTVIARHEKLRDKQTYLFILSLSFADILVGLFAQPLLTAVILGRHYKLCTVQKISHFVGTVASTGSGVGVTAISIDRLIYIAKPMHYGRMMSRTCVVVLLAYVWMLSIGLAAMPYLTRSVVIYHSIIIGGISLNSIVVIMAYSIIYYVAQKSAAPRSASRPRSQGHSQSQATRTIAAIVFAFFICWWPFSTISFLWALQSDEYKPESPIVSAYFWTLGLGHWNSSMNVVIYSLKNTELRREIRKCLGWTSNEIESSPASEHAGSYPSNKRIANFCSTFKDSETVQGLPQTMDEEHIGSADYDFATQEV